MWGGEGALGRLGQPSTGFCNVLRPVCKGIAFLIPSRHPGKEAVLFPQTGLCPCSVQPGEPGCRGKKCVCVCALSGCVYMCA